MVQRTVIKTLRLRFKVFRDPTHGSILRAYEPLIKCSPYFPKFFDQCGEQDRNKAMKIEIWGVLWLDLVSANLCVLRAHSFAIARTPRFSNSCINGVFFVMVFWYLSSFGRQKSHTTEDCLQPRSTLNFFLVMKLLGFASLMFFL